MSVSLKHGRLAVMAGLTLALFAAESSFAGRFTGTITATQACEAYTNKPEKAGTEKKNPDNAKLRIGDVYEVVDVNKPAGPTWLRVEVEDANPTQRWVESACGKVDVKEEVAKPKANCSQAGQADSYVFAVSWQAAFCETHQAKPECAAAKPTNWSAGHFTLHGLWPNLSACGTNYGFCSTTPKAAAFCDYPEPAIKPATFKQLTQVMPSAGAGSCLQRHEWYKHGTCQTNWDADGYFEVAIQLVNQFNAGAAKFFADNVGKEVKSADFYAAIDQGLGAGAHERMKFTCNLIKDDKGSHMDLVDIYMNLPANIPAKPDLKALLQAGKPGFSSNCGDSFRVEAVMAH